MFKRCDLAAPLKFAISFIINCIHSLYYLIPLEWCMCVCREDDELFLTCTSIKMPCWTSLGSSNQITMNESVQLVEGAEKNLRAMCKKNHELHQALNKACTKFAQVVVFAEFLRPGSIFFKLPPPD